MPPRGKVHPPQRRNTRRRRREYGGGYQSDEAAWVDAIKVKNAVEARRRVPPSRRSLSDFFVEWLAAIEASVKPTTYVNYVDYGKSYVLPTIGKRQLQELDVPTLNTFYRRLLASGRRKPDNSFRMYEFWQTRMRAGVEASPREIAAHCKVSIYAARDAAGLFRRGRVPVAKTAGLAPRTVKNIHRMLHRALSDAVAWRYIEFNPAQHASLPREKRKSRRQPGATWTTDELNLWLKVAVQDRDAGIWVLAATTGMRRSELAGVDKALLDLGQGRLTIEDTRVVVAGRAQESDGKTESGRRTISLDALTVHYLRSHLAMINREEKEFGQSYRHHGKLVCHPNGTPVHPGTITTRFNRLVDRAGVPRIRLHDVRHTYATLALDAGVEPRIVSDRIGHANMAYTLTIYTHPSTAPAAEKIAGLIFGADWRHSPDERDDPDEGGPVPALV